MPPYCEYFVRCIGKVCPNEKKAEVALPQRLYFIFPNERWWENLRTCSGNIDHDSRDSIYGSRD
jgi:hypothetical protein